MFVDKVKITIKAGDGGNGAVSFHREKYVANGGPDGGDGGKGGDIIFIVDDTMNTLIDFKRKKKFIAQNGENGKMKNMRGKSAENLYIKVPRGTIIRETSSGKIVKDMSDTDEFTCLVGGKGGWGNVHFATPTRQIPRFAKSGILGESCEVTLELKLIADVGLLGFPNVGKSTLISMVSAARPKIANYHFTTLVPNLGVVSVAEEKSFVMADIPGIIEGASEGIGLGHEFLRHIERCRLLVHVVDVSGSEGRNPINDFEIINNELKNYSSKLSQCIQIVAANKIDIISDEKAAKEFKEYVCEKGYQYFEISAATNKGLNELVYAISNQLDQIPKTPVYESEINLDEELKSTGDRTVEVSKLSEGVYNVEGKWLINLVNSVNVTDYESLQYFHRTLKMYGVFEKLEELGIQDGDTVIIYDAELDYMK